MMYATIGVTAWRASAEEGQRAETAERPLARSSIGLIPGQRFNIRRVRARNRPALPPFPAAGPTVRDLTGCPRFRPSDRRNYERSRLSS